MNGPSWRAFRLLPDDVLFFRDGKPSTRGTDHYLRSLFPPHPATLYGALRTRRLVEAGVDLQGLVRATWKARLGPLVDELGDWGSLGSLRLRGPWLVRADEALVPAPADLGLRLDKSPNDEEPPRIAAVVRFRRAAGGGNAPAPAGGGASHDLEPLAPHDCRGGTWSRLGLEAGEARPSERYFLKPAGLAAWRAGGLPAAEDFVHPSELWRDEPRTGIGLEAARRMGSSGDLYTFGFIRLLAGVSLGFEVAGSLLAGGGRVRFGGEGRTAMLEAGGPCFPAAPAAPPSGDTRCVALVTPALSAAGAYPPGYDAIRREARLGLSRLHLLSAVVPRFTTVGGWDLATQSPKILRRALPAGSTYLFAGGDAETLGALDGTCISDFPAEGLAQQGFGLVIAGLSG
jgi:CRISPR-associated protein Cmr3